MLFRNKFWYRKNINPPGVKPEYSGITRSIPWLLIPWRLRSSGHQRPWYWLCAIWIVASLFANEFQQHMVFQYRRKTRHANLLFYILRNTLYHTDQLEYIHIGITDCMIGTSTVTYLVESIKLCYDSSLQSTPTCKSVMSTEVVQRGVSKTRMGI